MKNTADANESITFSAGSGVTLVYTSAVAVTQNRTGTYLVVITNATSGSEAVSIYWLGESIAS